MTGSDARAECEARTQRRRTRRWLMAMGVRLWLAASCLGWLGRWSDLKAAPWVRSGVTTNAAVWGVEGGLQFALPPAGFRGGEPRGLIRLGYPVRLGGGVDLINFVAVEPVVGGRRGFSELEQSRRDGRPGLLLEVDPEAPSGRMRPLAGGAEELVVGVRVERFENGAHVRLVLAQRTDRSDELEFTVHAEPDSAPMDACILTATMGNLIRARQLWVREGPVLSTHLYAGHSGDGFGPHHVFPLEELPRVGAEVLVALTTDEESPDRVLPFPNSQAWRYGGRKVTQYWRKPAAEVVPALQVAVNARATYWRTQQHIPGGVAYENFELREPFREGQRLTFGITHKSPADLGVVPRHGRGGWGRMAPRPPARRVPVIDVTDLYHPPQDPGDNFDLIAAYALPEVDLRAVVLDVSEAFRKPIADHPGLYADPEGPRDPGFIPVLQLNRIFGRPVPAAAAPFRRMRSPEDRMEDAPAFEQQGIDLILRVLRESCDSVEIVSFGSARPVAVAYNREPELLRRKVRRLHLCAGASEPGYLEWNVLLDPHAFVRLLQSDLPVALYPCATKEGPFAYGRHNCYWKLESLGFLDRMAPALQRYVAFALGRARRADFLRALEDDAVLDPLPEIVRRPHNVWETAVWLNVSGRRVVRRADGRHRILPAHEVAGDDTVLPNDLRPCRVTVRPNGEFTFEPVEAGLARCWIYDRGDALENERALREALPAWYEAIRP